MPPLHLIGPDEVAAWLADSIVKTVTIHRTDQISARDITERGVDIGRASPDAGWGRGFYSTLIPDRRFGEAEVRIAVRLVRPLVILDSVRDAEVLETLTSRAANDDFREAILAGSYDGVVIHFGPGDITVVAFWDEQVKVVVGERGRG